MYYHQIDILHDDGEKKIEISSRSLVIMTLVNVHSKKKKNRKTTFLQLDFVLRKRRKLKIKVSHFSPFSPFNFSKKKENRISYSTTISTSLLKTVFFKFVSIFKFNYLNFLIVSTILNSLFSAFRFLIPTLTFLVFTQFAECVNVI